MEFNENLKEARKGCKLTQQDVADALGIDKSTYSGYETGKREPDVKRIKALSLLFDVSPEFLIGMDNSPKPDQPTFSPDTLAVAAEYEAADGRTRNKVRCILDMELIPEQQVPKQKTS